MDTDTVAIIVPRAILDSARMSVDDAKLELAVALYAQRRLSVGKARQLAGMTLAAFRRVLADRRIPVDYDEDDLEGDLATMARFGF